MDAQARQLIGLIDNITYSFGMQSLEGRCCNENISHGEFRALQVALHQTICTMQDIARSAAVTKSGATRIAKRLEEKGLAIRQQDHKDGRICCVTPTEKGQTLLNRIEDQLMCKMREILAAMDPAMREILILSLNAFVQAAKPRGVHVNPQREMCCAIEEKDTLGNG
ncbi:DNA-binding transcriptional regulator, MarR family [Syntrophus gentianae]|uniref:DNA-binding transcriptional regulator, MarR family n=2 Tax=Syntrophus gentianae TaxID=43775 RepID=A0A1H8A131_9BACT|nr:DNA-binding transcriptional regulator, MarR family [Syntrophus gentianae]